MLIMMQWLKELIMATEQDLKNQLSTLRQAILDDQTNDQKAVDSLETVIASANTQIKQLQDQLAKLGGNPDTVNFDDIISQLKDVQSLIVPVTTQLPPGETPVGP
jgi:hypothetical protein